MKPRSPIARKSAPRKVSAKKLAANGGKMPFSTIAPAKKKPGTKSGMMRRSSKKPWRRDPKDFARIYGSDERVEWVNAQPCAWCVNRGLKRMCGPTQNAHTETGGTGYKAGFETIAPLGAKHHDDYDNHRAPFDTPVARLAVKALAAKTQELWQRECARRGMAE